MRWGLLFLNNRYHDPNLGVFISVDPLVNVTGEPYLYGSGNPTTLSDPTGLEPGCWANNTPALAAICAASHMDVKWLVANSPQWADEGKSYWESRQPGQDLPGPKYLADRGVPQGSTIGGVDLLDPLEQLVDDAAEGLDQLLDPLTCGLRGINPVTKQAGSCTPEEKERREDYQEAGEAVCEASQTPIIGSAIPEQTGESWAWFVAGGWVSAELEIAKSGGVPGAAAASSYSSYVVAGATAVDAYCRWGAP